MKRCSYLCGPHLERCTRDAYHEEDCTCLTCEPLMPLAYRRWRAMRWPDVLREMAHLFSLAVQIERLP